MKNKSLLIVVGVVALIAGYFVVTYNSLAKASQEVAAAWANVETQYQRRSDLIPNLVNTVKGYAAFEEETLTKVISARNAALKASNTSEKQAAEGILNGANNNLAIELSN